ncbi:hypothetical protein SGFS_092420 [Streptomyces graminofaciens]|uniref:G5 domain-containing protein n=1 Tax=Streptomyces graminofaciens TaxID=68212 RepID=A0ABM7FLG2_9ACTN|nr:hypothetical protein [Streptomyces graminofaciens]BBC37948.1 hypothetical protein SGFS_092420 [Streptomyces graminofaciens]
MIPTTRHRRGIEPAKGDRAEKVVGTGDTTRTYEVIASGAGRRVEAVVRRGGVEVSEVTLPRKKNTPGVPSGKTPRPRTSSPPRGVRRRSSLILREARQSVRGHDDPYPPHA